MTQSNSKPEHRPIRSFVRRSGRLTPSQARALGELWPTYGIDVGKQPLDFIEHFGREAPRVLEIGFGNGESLIELATEQSDKDFIGIEVHEPGVGHCLMHIRNAGIRNVRLIMHDAVPVLERLVPPGSLTRINLYFPDPWPKKRHHKRRIVQAAFIELCARALESGGTLCIATDWENYAEQIDAVLSASAKFEISERREHQGERPLDRPRTKFEQRGLRHGHKIWDWKTICVK